ncbi:hypothetical protein HPP92_003322 [Vanilla planifolia]|uniref:cellulase n=1 Tax=Vanilla planifolia TaxID=51239 RepID=A0A835SA57_VANPL|nr:hypothetical protein HPP92_003322 [Vanilla planifolia]
MIVVMNTKSSQMEFFLPQQESKMVASRCLVVLCIVLSLFAHGKAGSNYKQALTKSILYFEAQRSGKLPGNQRVTWHGDSALRNGSDAGVRYIMSTIQAGGSGRAKLPRIRPLGDRLFAKGAQCSQRALPLLFALRIHRMHLIFSIVLSRNHPGLYQNSIPVAGQFYPSSGSDDELLWAAAWLHRATNGNTYLDFLGNANNIGGVRSMFSWDDKFVGAQVLISKVLLVLEKTVSMGGTWSQYKNAADQFICSVLQKGSNNVKLSPGRMFWWQPWNNFQYTAAATLALAAHSNYLSAAKASLLCPAGVVSPADILAFVGEQVDYLLGSNPKKISYMVGFGSAWPNKVHQRGDSIVSMKKDPSPVDCKGGFDRWFHSPNPNPSVIEGAVVGGPDADDWYNDDRENYQQAEPSTVTTAAFVGVLARLI